MNHIVGSKVRTPSSPRRGRSDPEVVARFVTLGTALDRAEQAGIPRARLDDLDHFRATVQGEHLEGFLLGLDAPFEARRLGLPAHGLAQLAALEGTPDLFGPLDHIRAETLHSRVLAWALSPRRLGPALGVEPLRAFLSLLAAQPDSDVRPEWADDAARVCARPEWHVRGCGRIDVWLELPDAIFAIEAKVDHHLRPGQLIGYRKAVQAPPGNRKRYVVFLPLQRGIDVSNVKPLYLTFEDVLTAWLPLAAAGRTGEHLYLASWLRTVSQHLANVSGTGPFSGWPRARRGRTLSLLEAHT